MNKPIKFFSTMILFCIVGLLFWMIAKSIEAYTEPIRKEKERREEMTTKFPSDEELKKIELY